MIRLRKRCALVLAAFTACLAFAACDRQEKLHPVRGQVTYRGRPLADALVVFHPDDESPGGKSMAYTNDQGEFQLTTRTAGDGVAAGNYRVTIEWRALIQRGEEQTRSGRNLLPEKYADPATTPIRCSIGPGVNVLEPFVVVE